LKRRPLSHADRFDDGRVETGGGAEPGVGPKLELRLPVLPGDEDGEFRQVPREAASEAAVGSELLGRGCHAGASQPGFERPPDRSPGPGEDRAGDGLLIRLKILHIQWSKAWHTTPPGAVCGDASSQCRRPAEMDWWRPGAYVRNREIP